MGRLFGTDGVRGIANLELHPRLAFDLGHAYAQLLRASHGRDAKVLIGRDTRLSCDVLEAALVAGICSAGLDLVLGGVMPTPAVAYLTTLDAYQGGIMISASHNSYEYNGLKFFTSEGFKLPDAAEREIEALIESYPEGHQRPLGSDIGRVLLPGALLDDYTAYLRQRFPLDLQGLRIAVDCAQGASAPCAEALFRSLGATVMAMGNAPNGSNINANCGSTHPEALQRLVLEEGCDLGFAFDGDADRMLAVDEKGELLTGDVLLALLARDMKRQGKLRHNSFVGTQMSNLGLEHFAKREQLQLLRTKVGDRYVLEEMLKGGYVLGGEQSGHFILLRENTTGDGLLSALAILRALKNAKESLHEAKSLIHLLPQVLINAKVAQRHKYQVLEDPDIQAAKQRIEKRLGNQGRLLLRPSGTEPFVRVMIEGSEQALIEDLAQSLAKLIASRFAA